MLDGEEKKRKNKRSKAKRKPIKRLLVILENTEARSQIGLRSEQIIRKIEIDVGKPTYRPIQSGLANDIIVCQISKV